MAVPTTPQDPSGSHWCDVGSWSRVGFKEWAFERRALVGRDRKNSLALYAIWTAALHV